MESSYFKSFVGVVHRMAVNSDYWKSGIGTELMKSADKLGLANNIRYLKIDTYSINIKMNELFNYESKFLKSIFGAYLYN